MSKSSIRKLGVKPRKICNGIELSLQIREQLAEVRKKNMSTTSSQKTIEISISQLIKKFNLKTLNLRPMYQRDLKWKIVEFSNMLHFIMSGKTMNIGTWYKYQENELFDSYLYEVMDGAHRCKCIYCFVFCLPVNSKGDLIYWKIGESYIFYEETDESADRIEIWRVNHNINPKNITYLTTSDKKDFDNLTIKFELINYPMTEQERISMFQTTNKSGKPVRGSDLYKTYHHIKAVLMLYEENIEARYKQIMLKHLRTKPDQYWVHFFIRHLLMHYTLCDDKTTLYWFNMNDRDIKRLLDYDYSNGSENYLTTYLIDNPSTVTEFLKTLNTFFRLLEKDNSLKLPPIMYYALYEIIMKRNLDNNEQDDLLGYLQDRNYGSESTKWHCKKDDRESCSKLYLQYSKDLNNFLDYKDTEDSIQEEEEIPQYWKEINNSKNTLEKRCSFSSKKKYEVWNRNQGLNKTGFCTCCERTQIDRNYSGWEIGHIISLKNNGSNELSNLTTLCFNCNRQMGGDNFNEYKEKFFPSR